MYSWVEKRVAGSPQWGRQPMHAHCSLARRPRPDSLLFRPPHEPRASLSLPASALTGGGTGEGATEEASLADWRPPAPSSAWRMPSAALRSMRPGDRFFFFLASWSCGGEGRGGRWAEVGELGGTTAVVNRQDFEAGRCKHVRAPTTAGWQVRKTERP